MKKTLLDTNVFHKYSNFLYREERSKATIEKYMRDIKHFFDYLPDNKFITKKHLVAYKQSLSDTYKTSSINSMLVSVNGLLSFMKLDKLEVKLHKVQRKVFSSEDTELTKEEYKRILKAADKKNNRRLNLLIQTICATGIRVSEHKYITVEALKKGQAVVNNKGKTRIILINKELKKLLVCYCKEKEIVSGPIFITKSGKPMDRSNIWTSMKSLCEEANVDEKKVFPHNLRHLFALTFYGIEKDVVRLADILGHSSIETTRIYTITSGKECQAALLKMGLIVSS